MKIYFHIILFIFPSFVKAQVDVFTYSKQQVDNMYSELNQTDNDSLKMEIYQKLGNHYLEKNKDSALYFAEKQMEIAITLKQPLWQGRALDRIGYINSEMGNYPKALQAANQALSIAENSNSEKNTYRIEALRGPSDPHINRMNLLASIYFRFSILYSNTGNQKKAYYNLLHAIKIAEKINDKQGLSTFYSALAILYVNDNKQDSALIFVQKSLLYNKESESQIYQGGMYNFIGSIYLQKGDYTQAKYYFQLSAKVNMEQKNFNYLGDSYVSLALFFLATDQPDSALIYSKKALTLFLKLKNQKSTSRVLASISTVYQKLGNTDSAFVYLLRSKTLGDSITQMEKIQTNQYQNLIFDEQIRLKKLEEERAEFRNKIRINTLLGGLLTLMIIAFFLYRNNRQKQKAKLEIEKAYSNLKSTQAQLIQSEKMASLGELTAGIAHEIQNPLNFVNNFSDLNTELIDEAKDELETNNLQEVKQILNDIKENEGKINLHGKRAESIVKGMLQHSRTSSGNKEPTDINALTDEYLRLAYHGLRAKDKSFHADFKLNADDKLPKTEVVPQDIGRVLLNLINNAFYAVREKAKTAGENYKPLVTVSTQQRENSVEIIVQDNGNGIPDNIKEKIFQPFFTTKPTGQGTGLGLSLSYDIVKAHGGELKVSTKEGTGTEFILTLKLT